jgi:hypothetical protein
MPDDTYEKAKRAFKIPRPLTPEALLTLIRNR